jgi:hypothetical protein
VRYILLIHTDEEMDRRAAGSPEFEAIMAGYRAVIDEVASKGILVASEPLPPGNETRTVRVRDGRTLITDGPFAETREQLGGYLILDCDLPTAEAYAARIPGASHGAVEVRALPGLG